MDTELHASVATFRVYTSGHHRPLSAPPRSADRGRTQAPPTRADRMAATPVTEGPLILSRLATNEMSYLQVNNFTRAVMPRSHIWRVSDTELVVPASFTNYWLITLSGSHRAVLKLDHILRMLCKYEVLGEEEAGEEAGEEADEEADEPANEPANEPPQTEPPLSEPPNREAIAENVAEGLQIPEPPTTVPDLRSSETQDSGVPLPEPANTAEQTAASPPDGSPDTQNSAIQPNTIQSGASVLASPPASPPIAVAGPEKAASPSPIVVKREARPRVRLITPPELEHATLNRTAKSKTAATATATAEGVATPSTPTTPSSPSALASDPKRSAASPAVPNSDPMVSLRQESFSPSRTPSPEPDVLPPMRNHATLQKTLDTRFGPRFTHPLIPSSHMDPTYPNAAAYSPVPHRLALQRRELLAVGPNSLHQDVTTVGGYIGLKAVNRLFRKT